jgi:hypothetical protein
MNNKFNMFVIFTRSFDHFHIKSSLTHLIASIFYSDKEYNLNDLKSLVDTMFWSLIVLRIRQDSSISLVNPSLPVDYDKIRVYDMNYTQFLNNKKMFFETMFGSSSDPKPIRYIYKSTNPILFIFDSVDWHNLKLILKESDIVLSGGTGSLRQTLSVSEFILSSILLHFKFEIQDLYSSNQFCKNYKGIIRSETSQNIDLSLLIKVLIDSYQNVINKLKKEEMDLEKRLEGYEFELRRKVEILSTLETRSSSNKKEEKLRNRIENLNSFILVKKEEILALKAQIKKNFNQIGDIQNKGYSFTKLWSIYETEFKENRDYQYISSILSNLITHTANLEEENRTNYAPAIGRYNYASLDRSYLYQTRSPSFRSYSTMVHYKTITNSNSIKKSNCLLPSLWCQRVGVDSTFLGQFLQSRLLGSVRKIHSDNIVSVESVPMVYANHAIIFKDLLDILYSDNKNKENVQIDMENYLKNKQHNKVLNQISTNIDYKLLNPNITKIILESKTDLNKLYNNYIQGLAVGASQPPPAVEDTKNSLFSEILNTVGFEYLSNILFGRLLFILSNNAGKVKVKNNNTKLTNVSYDLGFDLINMWKYKKYLSNKDSYSSFKDYKESYFFLYDNYITDATFITELGLILLGWVFELKLIKKEVVIESVREKWNILLTGNKFNNVIKENKNIPILNIPLKIPMIIRPKKYGDNKGTVQLGGYLLNDVCYTEPLIIDKPNLVEKSEIKIGAIIYDMVDKVNSVPFTINTDVLDFILNNYKKYELLIDLEYKHPLEDKNKLTINEKKELDSFNSKKRLER